MKEYFLKTDTPVANAIRRAAINRVRTLAIDKVRVIENKTPYFDEFIAHRLGMIPIKTEGVPPENTEIILTLEAEGPWTVSTEDIQGEVEIPYKIPLFTLQEGQRLRLELVVHSGYGRKHAKYQPCNAYYNIEKDGIRLFVEPYGQKDSDEILKEAIEGLIGSLKELERLL